MAQTSWVWAQGMLWGMGLMTGVSPVRPQTRPTVQPHECPARAGLCFGGSCPPAEPAEPGHTFLQVPGIWVLGSRGSFWEKREETMLFEFC